MAGSVMRIPSPAVANRSRPVRLCRIGALNSSSISISNCISCTPKLLNLQHKQRRKSSCCLSLSSRPPAAQVFEEKRRVPSKDYRNVGIMSHIDSTTDAQILYSKMCEQEQEQEQEQERGITINCSVISSHVDEVNGAIWLFDSVAANNIQQQPQSESIWRQADEYGIPRLCFINNMDHIGANFIQAKDVIETNLFAEPVVLQLPVGAGENFKGVIDLVKMKAVIWTEMGPNFTYQDIPEDLAESAEEHREILMKAIIHMDYGAVDMFSRLFPFEEATMKELIRLGTMSCAFVPVLCGSAFNSKGVQLLLDAVVDYLPSPMDLHRSKELSHHIQNQLATLSSVYLI